MIGLVIDLIIVGLLKLITKRQRPHLNETNDMVYGTNYGPDKYSFPSGHSSRSILIANLLTYLYFIQSKSLSLFYVVLLHLWSYMTCLSRLLLVRHFLSDVIIGILIGYLTFYLVLFYVV
jgi:membrane-associated phospholipid phosphatase